MNKQDVTGVIFIHSAPSALCSHLEWGISRILGREVRLNWVDQPALPGSLRAEYHWIGDEHTGAELASELRGWEHLRYEISQDPYTLVEGGRWMHTPDLGIFYAQTDALGSILISEDRIKSAMEQAGSNGIELQRELRLALGQAWDDELEVFRRAEEGSSVVWLHHRVG